MQKPFQLAGVDRETKYSSQWKNFFQHILDLTGRKKILFQTLSPLENEYTKGKIVNHGHYKYEN